MSSQPSPTYWDYLRLIPLLDLQGGLGDADAQLSEDELHFIVVHQVFELWFKLVLRELRLARDQFAADWVPERSIPHVVRHLGRVNSIFKLCVEVFGVLETLTPQDFLAFRGKLGESSGFQSFQMRQIEFLLGLLNALLTLVSFIGILWVLSGTLDLTISGIELHIPGYMVFAALIYAGVGSGLTYLVGRPIVAAHFLDRIGKPQMDAGGCVPVELAEPHDNSEFVGQNAEGEGVEADNRN